MLLYHGSYIEIAAPDLKHSRENVDFGRGFYTTPIFEQAVNWCKRLKRQGKQGVVSQYEFHTECMEQWNVLEFQTYSEKWLDFVLNCRLGKDTTEYDIVIGGVANDTVFNTVELFFDGLIDKKEAIKRLQYEKPNLQVCFRTEKVLKNLHFKGSEMV